MKVKSILIHAGVYKTGSTAIQSFFNSNRSNLIAHTDYAYPPGLDHTDFICTFCDDKVNNLYNRFYGIGDMDTINKNNEYFYNSVNEWIKKYAIGKKIIFSSEIFCDLSYGSLHDFKNYCHDLTNDIKVIMYARDPLSFALSSLSQHVKQGMIPKITNHSCPKIPYIDYIKKIDSVFGRESLEVYPFIKQTSEQNGVLSDFLDRVGITNSFFDKLDFVTNNNKSLSREAFLLGTHIITQLKLAGVELPESTFYHYCGQYLERIVGEKICLSNAEQISVIEDTRDDCIFLKDNFGIDFAPLVNFSNTIESTINSELLECIGPSVGKMIAGYFEVQKDFSADHFVLVSYDVSANGPISFLNPLFFVFSFSISQHLNVMNISLLLYNETGSLVFDVDSSFVNQSFYNLQPGCYESTIQTQIILPPGNYHAGFSVKVDDGKALEIARFGRLKRFTVHEPLFDRKTTGGFENPFIDFSLKKLGNTFFRKVNDCTGYIDVIKYDQNVNGLMIDLCLKIYNTSSENWFSLEQYPINLSYRIFSGAGDLIISDGERYKLPVPCLKSNESILMDVVIHLPILVDTCKIVISPVQEAVAWFDELGFSPLVLNV